MRHRLVLALILLGAIAAEGALAQCPMCGKSAEYAGGGPGEAYATLAAGALLLLVPALSILGGIARLAWKHRGGGD